MIQEILVEVAKGAIVGGLIGYATNRLAVAMLFRPHTPWKVFGLQVPMTPGLVVKNRERLAEAVGRSVSEDLLDHDTLLEHLRSARLHEIVEDVIHRRGEELANHEGTLADLLGTEISGSLHKALVPVVAGELDRFLKSPQGRSFIAVTVEPILDRKATELVGTGGIDALSINITSFLGKTLSSPEAVKDLEPLIVECVKEGLAGENVKVILEPLREPFQAAIPDITAQIQDGIADYLASEEFGIQARSKLSARISDLVVEKFPMAAMFVNERMVGEMITSRWESIADELIEMAHTPELGESLSERLEGLVDWLEEGIGKVLAKEETRERLASWAGGELVEKLPRLADSDTTRQGIRKALGETLDRPVGKILGTNPKEFARDLATRLSDSLTGENGRQTRERAAEAIVSQGVLGLRPNKVARSEVLGSMAHRVAHWVEGQVMEAAPEFLRDRLKIKEIVTEKIARFETEALEETIHRVSGRELKGIVRLGGVIGIFVGATAQLIYHFLL